MSTIASYGTGSGPAVLKGSTAAKTSSLTASALPYVLTLVAGISIGLIAVHVTGSGTNAVADQSSVGQYLSVVQGFNSQSDTSEAAAQAIKMKADNIAPACIVKCQEDFPLFSTAATKAVFDCHYFQVDWWLDSDGSKAMDCMRSKCNEEEQAKFRKAFECNCDRDACAFDEPANALGHESN